MRGLRLVLFTALAFALVMVWRFPANWARPLLPPQVKCSALGGTLWNGNCEGMTWTSAGQPPLQFSRIRWHAMPLQLLRARLAAQVELENAAGSASARVAMGSGDRVAISELAGSGLMDHTLLPALPAGWRAQLDVHDAQLILRGERVESLAGRVRAVDVVDQAGHAIGSYQLIMDSASGPPFMGHLTNSGGPVQLEAVVKIAADMSWELDGTVLPTAEASPSLQQQLQMLGPPDATGRRRISVAGTL
jgi:general secretion pathway protein N